MSVVMDPRIAARRRAVRELGAQRRLRWAVAVVVIAALGALAWWVVQSPLLAVRTITVAGMDEARAWEIATSAGLESGEPIVFVRSGAVRDALVADPWIRDARVGVRWPHTVDISVLLHEPVAWVGAGGNWSYAGVDGAVVDTTEVPPPWSAQVAIPVGAAAGGIIGDDLALAGVEFVAALPDRLARTTRVTAEGDQLWAALGSFSVRLGYADEMTRKADVVTAILDAGVEAGAVIDVLAPSRPAITGPAIHEAQDQVEG